MAGHFLHPQAHSAISRRGSSHHLPCAVTGGTGFHRLLPSYPGSATDKIESLAGRMVKKKDKEKEKVYFGQACLCLGLCLPFPCVCIHACGRRRLRWDSVHGGSSGGTILPAHLHFLPSTHTHCLRVLCRHSHFTLQIWILKHLYLPPFHAALLSLPCCMHYHLPNASHLPFKGSSKLLLPWASNFLPPPKPFCNSMVLASTTSSFAFVFLQPLQHDQHMPFLFSNRSNMQCLCFLLHCITEFASRLWLDEECLPPPIPSLLLPLGEEEDGGG